MYFSIEGKCRQEMIQAAKAVVAAGNFDGNTLTATLSSLRKEHKLADA